MITIQVNDSEWCRLQEPNIEPFALIDNELAIAPEIIDELRNISAGLRRIQQVIEDSGERVRFELQRTNNLNPEMLPECKAALAATILCSSECRASITFRTDYEMAECVATLLFGILERIEMDLWGYKPEWVKTLIERWHSKRLFYLNEHTETFRVAALAMNLMGFLNWKDYDKPDYDKFGVLTRKGDE